MELYLQFGYGMMKMSKHLIEKWGGGTVILSPRDLTQTQIYRFSSEINELNGNVVLDPQFYIPRASHERLISHSFWPDNYQTSIFNSVGVRNMLTLLKNQYNDYIESKFFILPSLFSSSIDEDWYNFNSLVVNEALSLNVHDELYCTLCLSHEVLSSEEQIHLLLEYVENWNVSGYYIVPEPPNKNYLVEDPNWLLNLLDLVAGLKHQNKKIIVGYANHQLLCLALAKIDAIASGKWLNVRSFNKEKFRASEESNSRRSKWYYCPQALSEYQIPFLDMAKRVGILERLETTKDFYSPYSDTLFLGAQPSTVNYPESNSFNHYIQCLKIQTQNSVKASYEATREGLNIQLETANLLTETFNRLGIRGKDRDFSKVVDVNLSAISLFDRLRGLIQGHIWNDLV